MWTLIFRLYLNISCDTTSNIWAYLKKDLEINLDLSISLITIANVSANIKDTRNSHPRVFLVKGVLKICSKFTGEHQCRSAISINLQRNFIETTLRHGCSVNLLHISRTPFLKNTPARLLLNLTQRAPETQNLQYTNTRCNYLNIKALP